jgi:hypothetical protein
MKICQPLAISLITAILTFCGFLGVIAVSLWAAIKRWISRYNDQNWLWDILQDVWRKVQLTVTGLRKEMVHLLADHALPTITRVGFPLCDQLRRFMERVWRRQPRSVQTTPGLPGPGVAPSHRHRASRWAVLRIALRVRAPKPAPAPYISLPPEEHHRDELPKPIRSPSIMTSKRSVSPAASMPRINLLQCSYIGWSHTSWVQNVRFSPDGEFLATSSHDGSSVVFDVRVRGCIIEATYPWLSDNISTPITIRNAHCQVTPVEWYGT